jgi:hybrid cluster-associated redox disulfide protein
MSDRNADRAISLDEPVTSVLARSSAVVGVFVRHRMACPGCAMAPYMTIAEAAHIYGLDPDLLVLELESAVKGLEP